jgi:hypothetical protein
MWGRKGTAPLVLTSPQDGQDPVTYILPSFEGQRIKAWQMKSNLFLHYYIQFKEWKNLMMQLFWDEKA